MLWAVTSFFGPPSRRRYENFKRFRAALPLPLCVVEATWPDAQSRLTSGDADMVLHRLGSAVQQREALYNYALSQLPRDCDVVLFVDADVLFSEPVRLEPLLREALTTCDVVQCCDRIYHLDATGRPLDVFEAAFAASAHGRKSHFPGFGWAFRRQTLHQLGGFFEGCVVGGFDSILATAAGVSQFKPAIELNAGAAFRAQFSAWQRLASGVLLRPGFIPLQLQHLWHGSLASREYTVRYHSLQDLDPARHLAHTEYGFFWTFEAPSYLKQVVRAYFDRRVAAENLLG